MIDRRILPVALTVGLAVLSPLTLRADVRADEKTHFQLAGPLGSIVNFFGGKAAREGTVTSQAVKGNRAARITEDTEQIIDLSEEKVYDLDLRKKTYKVTTFAELRQRMEETQVKAEENARKTQERADTKEKAAPSDQKDQQAMQVDVDIRNTGQKKTINGFDTSEEVMTIAVREKGKTLEEGGGLVLTMDLWITPAIRQMKEIQDFYARYRQQLSGSAMLSGVQVDQMAMITAMYPMMKQAIGRMNTEGDSIQGTPILQTLTFDSVKSAEQAAADAKQAQSPLDDPKIPANVGSLLSGFAKRAAAKKVAGNEDQDRARVTILTSTNEVLKVATSLSSDELAIPAGFKETK
jgi:hypothetical protein